MANGGGPFGIGDQILSGFFGNSTLRDYQHASRVFTTNSYELKPRFKFLFHVSFTLNVEQIPYLRGVLGGEDTKELSLLVKTIDLPRYNIQTEFLNQYNRKRLIQKKIEYTPINVTFHDDGGDNARRLWYYYYTYYYKDATQRYLSPNNLNGSAGANTNTPTGFNYNTRDIYNDTLLVKDWGYAGETWSDGTSNDKPPFFRDIRIYGMDQRKYAEYVLINPLIQSWSHDTYDYSQGNGIMQHQVTIAYETVKYYEGAIGRGRPDPNMGDFADPAHYDTTLSPIARPGANSTIFGQGGLLDAGLGILGDLQSGGVAGLIGAAQTAGRTYNTFKNKDIASLAKNETLALGKNQLLQSLPGATRQVMNRPNGVFIPTPAQTPQTATPGYTGGRIR